MDLEKLKTIRRERIKIKLIECGFIKLNFDAMEAVLHAFEMSYYIKMYSPDKGLEKVEAIVRDTTNFILKSEVIKQEYGDQSLEAIKTANVVRHFALDGFHNGVSCKLHELRGCVAELASRLGMFEEIPGWDGEIRPSLTDIDKLVANNDNGWGTLVGKIAYHIERVR